jgi:dTDP-4-amino-4,6-dideoxygalactose transaminase
MISIAQPLIGSEEKEAALRVLESGQLARGLMINAFEEHFAEYVGARFGVAVMSGTSALHLALLAHGIGPGDEVITPAFSFVASANCALYVGARPTFADLEPDYFTLDPNVIEDLITDRTRAIMPVHLYGQMCDMDAIVQVAEAYDLIIIQDACQAHGAELNSRPVGAYGTACYSFYATKNMTTGEGGMLVTNDPEVAERARIWREHGSRQRYLHHQLGFNLAMTEMQAAIGVCQLEKLDQLNIRRQENAAQLDEMLAPLGGVSLPKVRPGAKHVFHQYTIRVGQRDRVAAMLRDQGIAVGVYYPIPIHLQPFYKDIGYACSLPASESASEQVMSLPVHPGLSQDDIGQIVQAVSASVQDEAIDIPAAP